MPERKKTLIDYAKIGSIWALILSLWGTGYKTGEVIQVVKTKVCTYDNYGPRLDSLELWRKHVTAYYYPKSRQ